MLFLLTCVNRRPVMHNTPRRTISLLREPLARDGVSDGKHFALRKTESPGKCTSTVDFDEVAIRAM